MDMENGVDTTENNGVMNGPQFMDAAHHYANCETILKYGLSGIIRHARMRLEEKDLTDHQQDFLKLS